MVARAGHSPCAAGRNLSLGAGWKDLDAEWQQVLIACGVHLHNKDSPGLGWPSLRPGMDPPKVRLWRATCF